MKLSKKLIITRENNVANKGETVGRMIEMSFNVVRLYTR